MSHEGIPVLYIRDVSERDMCAIDNIKEKIFLKCVLERFAFAFLGL